jgi:hypothetical protein
LGCWLRAKESETGGVGEARRGEASNRLRAKGGRKGQGEMEMEEPYRDFDPFLSSPEIPELRVALFLHTPPKNWSGVSRPAARMSLGWKGSRPCQKMATTGTGGARESAGECVKGGLCCAVLEFCLEIHPSRPLLCERLASDTTALSECVLLRRGTRAPFSLLTDSPIPCDFRRRRYEVGKGEKKRGKGLLTVMCKRRLLRHGLKE